MGSPTARVSGRWEGGESPSKREKLKATTNARKRGAYPPVHCTLCWVASQNARLFNCNQTIIHNFHHFALLPFGNCSIRNVFEKVHEVIYQVINIFCTRWMDAIIIYKIDSKLI